MEETEIAIKPGLELSKTELDAINEAKKREWQNPPMSQHQLEISVFFLLKNQTGEVLSMCQILDIGPVKFEEKTYYLLGVGGMISNIRGKGYGKQVLMAIQGYAKKMDKALVGFCSEENRPYYEKCGLKTDPKSISRFVFYKEGKRLTNPELDPGAEHVIYLEGSDHFMEKVISHPTQEAILSREPDW